MKISASVHSRARGLCTKRPALLKGLHSPPPLLAFRILLGEIGPALPVQLCARFLAGLAVSEVALLPCVTVRVLVFKCLLFLLGRIAGKRSAPA